MVLKVLKRLNNSTVKSRYSSNASVLKVLRHSRESGRVSHSRIPSALSFAALVETEISQKSATPANFVHHQNFGSNIHSFSYDHTDQPSLENCEFSAPKNLNGSELIFHVSTATPTFSGQSISSHFHSHDHIGMETVTSSVSDKSQNAQTEQICSYLGHLESLINIAMGKLETLSRMQTDLFGCIDSVPAHHSPGGQRSTNLKQVDDHDAFTNMHTQMTITGNNGDEPLLMKFPGSSEPHTNSIASLLPYADTSTKSAWNHETYISPRWHSPVDPFRNAYHAYKQLWTVTTFKENFAFFESTKSRLRQSKFKASDSIHICTIRKDSANHLSIKHGTLSHEYPPQANYARRNFRKEDIVEVDNEHQSLTHFLRPSAKVTAKDSHAVQPPFRICVSTSPKSFTSCVDPFHNTMHLAYLQTGTVNTSIMTSTKFFASFHRTMSRLQEASRDNYDHICMKCNDSANHLGTLHQKLPPEYPIIANFASSSCHKMGTLEVHNEHQAFIYFISPLDLSKIADLNMFHQSFNICATQVTMATNAFTSCVPLPPASFHSSRKETLRSLFASRALFSLSDTDIQNMSPHLTGFVSAPLLESSHWQIVFDRKPLVVHPTTMCAQLTSLTKFAFCQSVSNFMISISQPGHTIFDPEKVRPAIFSHEDLRVLLQSFDFCKSYDRPYHGNAHFSPQLRNLFDMKTTFAWDDNCDSHFHDLHPCLPQCPALHFADFIVKSDTQLTRAETGMLHYHLQLLFDFAWFAYQDFLPFRVFTGISGHELVSERLENIKTQRNYQIDFRRRRWRLGSLHSPNIGVRSSLTMYDDTFKKSYRHENPICIQPADTSLCKHVLEALSAIHLTILDIKKVTHIQSQSILSATDAFASLANLCYLADLFAIARMVVLSHQLVVGTLLTNIMGCPIAFAPKHNSVDKMTVHSRPIPCY